MQSKDIYYGNNYTAIQIADMESAISNESLAEKEGEGLDKKCRIHVHSRTHRLADPDGRSIKAVIDGIREAGLLKDDSAKFITEITQSQEITKGNEETIIELHTGEINKACS